MQRVLTAEEAHARGVQAQAQRAARRMLQQDLARAFSKWAELGAAIRSLRHASARFTSPELARGFGQWLRCLETERAEAEAAERKAAEDAEAAKVRAAHERELAALRERLDDAVSEADAARAAKELAAQQLKEVAMRRMRNLPLARALSSWRGLVEERKRLRNATQLLRSPELGGALRRWRQFAREEADKGERQRVEQEVARRVAEVQAASDAALAAKEAEKLELLRRLDAAAMSAEEQRLLRAEQAARRMGRQGEARAFDTWADFVAYQRQLRHASARLHSPGLAHAFGEWRKAAALLARHRSAIENAEWERKFEEQAKLARSETERAVAQKAAEAADERRKLEAALDANRRAADEARRAVDRAKRDGEQRLALARGETERDLALKDEAAAVERRALLEKLEAAELQESEARRALERHEQQASEQAEALRSESQRLLTLKDEAAAAEARAAKQRLEATEKKLALAREELARANQRHDERLAAALTDSEKDVAMRDEAAANERRVLVQRLQALEAEADAAHEEAERASEAERMARAELEARRRGWPSADLSSAGCTRHSSRTARSPSIRRAAAVDLARRGGAPAPASTRRVTEGEEAAVTEGAEAAEAARRLPARPQARPARRSRPRRTIPTRRRSRRSCTSSMPSSPTSSAQGVSRRPRGQRRARRRSRRARSGWPSISPPCASSRRRSRRRGWRRCSGFSTRRSDRARPPGARPRSRRSWRASTRRWTSSGPSRHASWRRCSARCRTRSRRASARRRRRSRRSSRRCRRRWRSCAPRASAWPRVATT